MTGNNQPDVYKETAYAKINLALHIRGKREDGYHILDTLFAFVDGGDGLSAVASDQMRLDITGPYAAHLQTGPDNLVLRAAELLRVHYKIERGASIVLDKQLPVASGIGGGSADAAAAARLLCRMWGVTASPEHLARLLAPIGADVPACIESKTVRGLGTGTVLEPVEASDLKGIWILLVNPNIAVATGAVFAQWTGGDSGILIGNTACNMMIGGRNDLQPLALGLCPEIGIILELLKTQSPIISRMSGSGATCFALFPNEPDCKQAAQNVMRLYPAFWVMTGQLR
jgi:4-diphosphocytidyl-2-C-methyl-D-erythritol kinase